MKRKKGRKLSITKETVAQLDAEKLQDLPIAGAGHCPQESALICSIQHTCVSCQGGTIEA
ncbi:MAG TPA: class I lanthipeptide [Thermoanaerobaculia bacterium]|nr:class I lanthipeptide [Thermoanaerobaculia bacterium]